MLHCGVKVRNQATAREANIRQVGDEVHIEPHHLNRSEEEDDDHSTAHKDVRRAQPRRRSESVAILSGVIKKLRSI